MNRLLGSILVLAFSPLASLAVNNFQMKSSPAAQVSVSKADDAACTEAAGIASDEYTQTLRGYAIHLTNRAARGITVLTVIWKVTDQAGHTSKHRFLSDSYTFPKLAYVIPPHGDAILWPLTMYVRQLSGGGWLSSPTRPDTRRAKLFAGAESVEVSVDVVAFENGQFFGDDTESTIDNIRARRDLARQVTSSVRQAQISDTPIDQVLNGLRQSVPSSAEERWRNRFAQDLLTAGNHLEDELRYLENFPEIPTFVRITQHQ